MKKRMVSLLLAIAIVKGLSLPSLALNSGKNYDLYPIAEETIQISEEVQESGALVITYENLNLFVNNVREQYPDISDRDIALFIIQYTEQDCESLPEQEILSMLEYDNISTSTSYAKVTKTGELIESSAEEALLSAHDVFTSNDGYMQLTTNFSKRKTVGSDKYFTVWTSAKWLQYPQIAIKDTLVLGTNGTFDSSFDENGYVHQTFRCTSYSTHYTYLNRDVDVNNTVCDDLSLEYDNYTPYLTFIPISPRCDHCGEAAGATDYAFRAYLKYGIITDSTCNIQAGYGHTKIGLGNISVSISAEGTPSISGGLATTLTPYIARAVTVK